ncbi:SDR family NAD(P)-dependent oxidoreductase [Chloroflexota bacterium]
MADLFDLKGKVAVVTGGAGGIGRAVALGLAECGADVVVTSRQLTSLEQVVNEIRALGRQGLAIASDVTQEQSVADMVKGIMEVFPRIDILVNSHGINNRNPDLTIDEWQQVMDVNTRGTYLTCKAVGEVMVKQGGGKIINVSSVRGRYATQRGGGAYCVSKAAVDMLTRGMACELGGSNVRVNAIAPCVVETSFMPPSSFDGASADRLSGSIPIGRWAQPEDMVGPVLFLASKSSDFVTGHILYVDGGLTVKT